MNELERKKDNSPGKVKRHPHGPAKTSARAIQRKQREAEVLEYRLQGHDYATIGKTMHLPAQTACDYAMRAMARIVPAELPAQVLKLELQRLDQLQAAIYDNASNGETVAIETYLKISNLRCRLLNLFPNEKGGGVHVNIGTGSSPSAEETGIEVRFVLPDRVKRLAAEQDRQAKVAKVIEGFPEPMLKPL
jgi:hypothetical protein